MNFFMHNYKSNNDKPIDWENQEEKINNLTKSIELNPKSFKAYFERGNIYYQYNKFKKAIEDYSMGLNLKEGNFHVYLKRGICYSQIKEFLKAIEDFTKVIEQISYPTGIGKIRRDLLDHSNQNFAESELQEFMGIAYANRGTCYNELKQFEAAISDYSIAIELMPSFSIHYINSAYSHNKIRQFEKAIIDCDAAIKLDPKSGSAYTNKGSALEGLKKYKEAISMFTKAINLGSNQALNYYNRGNQYAHLNKYSKSIEDYSRALIIEPNFRIAYLNRFASNMNNGNREGAIIDINAYVYLSVKSQETLERLKDIVHIYDEFPENIRFILNHFNIEVESLIFNPLETILKKNRPFNLFLLILKKSKWFNANEYSNIEAILRYHMGGCLTTYDMLDNKHSQDGLTFKTNEEYFYWSLTSSKILINSEEDIECSLKEMKCSSEIEKDNYYAGQICLLNDDRKSAINYFSKSSKYIFSKIMLAFCTEDKKETQRLIEEINMSKLDSFIPLIDFKTKPNLYNYFHYLECYKAINILKNSFGLITDNNESNVQALFQLDSHAKIKDLGTTLYSIEIIDEIENIFEEFGFELLESGLNESEVSKRLKRSKELFKDIYEKVERNIKEGNDPENEIRTVIESYSAGSKKFYVLLMAYFSSKNRINKEQVFFLTLFLIKMEDKRKDDKLFRAVKETSKKALTLTRSMNNMLLFRITLTLFKSGVPELQNYINKNDAFDNSETEYYRFKENMVLYFKHEKLRLNESEFKEKYKLSKYFLGDILN